MTEKNTTDDSLNSLDIRGVMNSIPHRYPFLLIDRVIDFTPNKNLVGIKNVTYNEPFFPGHFPGRPVMPGVMIVEALAQATGVLVYNTIEKLDEGTYYYFVGIDKARFRQPVTPGDQLRLEVTVTRRIKTVWRFAGVATVDGKVVATADLMCAPGP